MPIFPAHQRQKQEDFFEFEERHIHKLMQIKTTLSFHLITVKMAGIDITKNRK